MSLHVPDMGKRPRDELTEALIQEALEEEAARKRQKKGDADPAAVRRQQEAAKQQRKGQTLAEIEAAEGGPVKESLVGMAAVQRALRRKKAPAAADDDETDPPADITAYEEGDEDDADDHNDGHKGGSGQRPGGISEAIAAAMEGDGGFATTGFNMRQEREEGNIDEEGNFIPVADEDDTAKDAWLNSAEAKEVSDKVKAAFAARQAAMEAEDTAPALSETAVAEAQREIAGLLLPGESVAAGLRRLGAARKPAAGSKALGKREKQRLAAQQAAAAAAGGGAAAGDVAAAEGAFTRLTELADLLLNSGGELDVYSHKREQLERWAAAVLPQTNLLAEPEGAGDGDMFASDEGEDGKQKQQPASKQSAAAAAPAAAAAAPGTPPAEPASPAAGTAGATSSSAARPPPAAAAAATAAAAAAPQVDYGSWPVKELRRLLSERGVDSSGMVDKSELVAKVREVADQAAAARPPPGYVFDRSSGFFWGAEAGLFWDQGSGGFYNPSDQKWYSFDTAAGQFVEWPQQQQQ